MMDYDGMENLADKIKKRLIPYPDNHPDKIKGNRQRDRLLAEMERIKRKNEKRQKASKSN